MEFTGERMIPEENAEMLLYAEHMARYLFAKQFVQGKSVLDIACGSGYGTQYLAQHGAADVVGIDNAADAIAYAGGKYAHPRARYIVGDARKIPLPDHSIDVVVSFETIEHFEEQDIFMRELKRVMREKGIALFSTPNASVYPAGNTFHKHEFTIDTFTTFLRTYYPHVQLLYQQNTVADVITGATDMHGGTETMITSYDTYRLATVQPKDKLYLIAVCSEHAIKTSLHGISAIFNDHEMADPKTEKQQLEKEKQQAGEEKDRMASEIVQLKTTITALEQRATALEAQLQRMMQSRSWRYTAFLRNLLTKTILGSRTSRKK